MTVAEFLRIELESVKYPKSTNTLVKNDFVHRIKTIDLQITYNERIANTVFEPLFFDTYFDTIGSQRKQENGILRSKTRVDLSNGDFIDPDAIF